MDSFLIYFKVMDVIGSNYIFGSFCSLVSQYDALSSTIRVKFNIMDAGITLQSGFNTSTRYLSVYTKRDIGSEKKKLNRASRKSK